MSRNPLPETVREILSRASYGTDGRREPTCAEAGFGTVLGEAFPNRARWLLELADGDILTFVARRDSAASAKCLDADELASMLRRGDVAAVVLDGTWLPSAEEVRAGFDRQVGRRGQERSTPGLRA